MEHYINIIIRSASVYLFLVAAIRIFGRKELSQLSTADLVFIVLISNAVQNAMVGPDSSLQGGILAALVLFCINYLLKQLLFRSPRLKDIIEDTPVILVHDGKKDTQNLFRLKISEEELEEAVREHGLYSTTQVKLAILEVDGNISIISEEEKHLKQTHYKRRRSHRSLNSMG